jgi:predicted membrane protein DUF2306
MTIGHLMLRYAHITAGTLTLLSGAAAMTLRKGSPLHRKAGNVFFVSMLVLSSAGVVLSLIKAPNMGNIMGGTMAFYMVATAWATVIRKPGEIGRFEIVAALGGLTIATGATTFGVMALNSANGRFYGYPPLMYFIFAGVAALATTLDLRMIVRGGLTGVSRTTRHLWRMSLAFFMATGSFFFGQPKFVPAILHETRLYIVAGLLPLALLLYWLVRVRVWPLITKARAPRMAQPFLRT